MLLAANVAVFASYALDDAPPARRRWLRSFLLSRGTFAADPGVLVRHFFAHMDPLHLFFNLYTLHSFGGAAHAYLGPARFLALYFAAGLAGGAAQLSYPALARALRWPAARDRRLADVPSLGASGAVFGLVG